MPTFSAVALHQLLDQRASSSAAKSNLDRGNSKPVSVPNRNQSTGLPPPHPKFVRGPESTPIVEKKSQWPHISPALYATPESKPVPHSPTSFPPSPYIINHKRRGPKLQKSSSEASVHKGNVHSNSHLSDAEIDAKSSAAAPDFVPAESTCAEEEKVHGFHEEKIGKSDVSEANAEGKEGSGSNLVERGCEIEDFFDPFYDASEELPSDCGYQPKSSKHDLETEVHEMRMSLLVEVERRKQAEDALNNMRCQWKIFREKLSEAGLNFSTYPCIIPEDGQMNVESMEDICQQVYITRFVSMSIGRGAARAEYEEEMEAQLESKSFEIARLCDRLHYYETMNREMSQRNQEAIEMLRRDRKKRRNRQKWVWRSIVAAIGLSSAALAWPYLPCAKGSLSCQLNAPE